MKKSELLAPAGNMDKLKAVFNAGADAAYAALNKFSLRAQADNFSLEEFREAMDLANKRGKKIYLALNIFARNEHLEEMKNLLSEINTIKPHGLIVSDLGVFRLCNDYCGEIPVHWSTQANTTNFETVNYLWNRGVRRFNLARELSFEEIKNIKKKVNAEIEVFVHGAMCMAYSGRCLLSAVLNNRSSNLGLCTHPCRWNFFLKEESRGEERFPVQEDENGTYIFNSKDLCLIEEIPFFVEQNIDSLKIEGRMKSLNYAATVVSVYREAIDVAYQAPDEYLGRLENWKKRLNTSDHRGFTKGFFYNSHAMDTQNYSDVKYFRSYQTIGIVRKIYNKELILIELKNKITKGDVLESLNRSGEWGEYHVKDLKDVFLNPLDSAHPNDYVLVPYTKRLPLHGIIRKKTD